MTRWQSLIYHIVPVHCYPLKVLRVKSQLGNWFSASYAETETLAKTSRGVFIKYRGGGEGVGGCLKMSGTKLIAPPPFQVIPWTKLMTTQSKPKPPQHILRLIY